MHELYVQHAALAWMYAVMILLLGQHLAVTIPATLIMVVLPELDVGIGGDTAAYLAFAIWCAGIVLMAFWLAKRTLRKVRAFQPPSEPTEATALAFSEATLPKIVLTTAAATSGGLFLLGKAAPLALSVTNIVIAGFGLIFMLVLVLTRLVIDRTVKPWGLIGLVAVAGQLLYAILRS